MQNISYSVVNIVASTIIGTSIDLKKLYQSISNSEYDPEFYHALKYKIKNPKATILVIKTGKILICGVKSSNEIVDTKNIFFQDIKKNGYIPLDNPIKIENIVISGQFHYQLDYKKIIKNYNSFRHTSLRHPSLGKQSSRLIFKHSMPRFSAMIFNSGKFTMAGLNNFEMIDPALQIISDFILTQK